MINIFTVLGLIFVSKLSFESGDNFLFCSVPREKCFLLHSLSSRFVKFCTVRTIEQVILNLDYHGILVNIILDLEFHGLRSHGKRKNGNFKRKHKTLLSLFDLNIPLNSGRHQMLSKLTSLSVSSLRKLDEEANKFLIENIICMKQLSLLDVILNMLFVLTLILKLTTLDTSSNFHSLIKVLNS